MGFVSGDSVSATWFDDTGSVPLKERRLNTLDALARAMSQLQKFQFPMIGSLESEDGVSEGKSRIGPWNLSMSAPIQTFTAVWMMN